MDRTLHSQSSSTILDEYTHKKQSFDTFLVSDVEAPCHKSSSTSLDERTHKESYDTFLVLDVEATCHKASGFDWPNEIIEWPVCLMQWKDGRLKIVDEFHSFVKPTWKPQLSKFCTELTGITQDQVDSAPIFTKVLEEFANFLHKHELIDEDGIPQKYFCWCTDGPWDMRDFLAKQCFISKIDDTQKPPWLMGKIFDVRKAVSDLATKNDWQITADTTVPADSNSRPPPLNIELQLLLLGLPKFVGRQHSGIDDARNIARVVTELFDRVLIIPNRTIPLKVWQWMGSLGKIVENFVLDDNGEPLDKFGYEPCLQFLLQITDRLQLNGGRTELGGGLENPSHDVNQARNKPPTMNLDDFGYATFMVHAITFSVNALPRHGFGRKLWNLACTS